MRIRRSLAMTVTALAVAAAVGGVRRHDLEDRLGQRRQGAARSRAAR